MAKKRPFKLPKEQIAEFCKEYHIKRLSLFGSSLRPDFRPESDIDLLVEFEEGYKIGLLKMAHMENAQVQYAER